MFCGIHLSRFSKVRIDWIKIMKSIINQNELDGGVAQLVRAQDS